MHCAHVQQAATVSSSTRVNKLGVDFGLDGFRLTMKALSLSPLSSLLFPLPVGVNIFGALIIATSISLTVRALVVTAQPKTPEETFGH